ncbi:hypothetical protein [Leifsonia virtsii]|uniref:Excisionase n=1 Tax=Leifsonia virtsii TaxID=3035915 RepID=A0ABT8ISW3_9MICO|nr:hypothetical protein [Leifsonia virtsii]MDN4595893.1 hypothetical protein [Leifsonia virtsii]
MDDKTRELRWVGDRLRALQRGEPVDPWPMIDGEPDRTPWLEKPREAAPTVVRIPSMQPSIRRVAYSLEAAAEECGVSAQFLRGFVNRHELIVHYANTKMVVLADDLNEWIESLPTER